VAVAGEMPASRMGPSPRRRNSSPGSPYRRRTTGPPAPSSRCATSRA